MLPGDDVFGVQDSTILSALVAPFKSLVWSFRTFDSASAGFCLSLHHAASRVIINWASAMAGQPSGANLAKYATADPNTLRSCAVDVLVTLGIICKVRVCWCESTLSLSTCGTCVVYQIASLPLAMDANGAPKSVSDLQTKVAVLQLCGESIAVAGDVSSDTNSTSMVFHRCFMCFLVSVAIQASRTVIVFPSPNRSASCPRELLGSPYHTPKCFQSCLG